MNSLYSHGRYAPSYSGMQGYNAPWSATTALQSRYPPSYARLHADQFGSPRGVSVQRNQFGDAGNALRSVTRGTGSAARWFDFSQLRGMSSRINILLFLISICGVSLLILAWKLWRSLRGCKRSQLEQRYDEFVDRMMRRPDLFKKEQMVGSLDVEQDAEIDRILKQLEEDRQRTQENNSDAQASGSATAVDLGEFVKRTRRMTGEQLRAEFRRWDKKQKPVATTSPSTNGVDYVKLYQQEMCKLVEQELVKRRSHDSTRTPSEQKQPEEVVREYTKKERLFVSHCDRVLSSLYRDLMEK